MTMNYEEHKRHARRLLQNVVEDPEYGYVYEDELLEEIGATEEDWQDIHKLMCYAKATFSWPEDVNDSDVNSVEGKPLRQDLPWASTENSYMNRCLLIAVASIFVVLFVFWGILLWENGSWC